MSKLFLICGILFTAYYIGIIVYAGRHASFAWIWAALGAVCWLALAVCRVSALQAAFLRVPADAEIVEKTVTYTEEEGCTIAVVCVVTEESIGMERELPHGGDE